VDARKPASVMVVISVHGEGNPAAKDAFSSDRGAVASACVAQGWIRSYENSCISGEVVIYCPFLTPADSNDKNPKSLCS
jgi:hypothetical protein